MNKTLPRLSSSGSPFPSERLGFLNESTHLMGDFEALRQAIERDGYLFIKGFHSREKVLEARQAVLSQLKAEGIILDDKGPDESKVAEGVECAFRPDLASLPLIPELLYSDQVMSFFSGLFKEESLHYDYTWLRAVSPGLATKPHYDIVYMGRGTEKVCTLWTPLSDIDWPLGGLAILENSHKNEELKSSYGKVDVDRVCSNKQGRSEWEDKGLIGFGALPDSVGDLATALGGRWLTSTYQMGDVLIFSMHTLHCSTDNQTDRIRLSTDSRYQPASLPADERWVGASPVGHGEKAKQEMIC